MKENFECYFKEVNLLRILKRGFINITVNILLVLERFARGPQIFGVAIWAHVTLNIPEMTALEIKNEIHVLVVSDRRLKGCLILLMLWTSRVTGYIIFCINIWPKTRSCVFQGRLASVSEESTRLSSKRGYTTNMSEQPNPMGCNGEFLGSENREFFAL